MMRSETRQIILYLALDEHDLVSSKRLLCIQLNGLD